MMRSMGNHQMYVISIRNNIVSLHMYSLQANSMDLVSENHAWILPAYYNPNWWRLPSNDSMFESQNGNCSNEKMEEILESVIFIKNTKFPPLVSFGSS